MTLGPSIQLQELMTLACALHLLGWHDYIQDYGELEESIRFVLEDGGLQQPDAFVTKIIQLFDTLNVRFGVMLVGPTGGGKTACSQALQQALTRLRQKLRSKDERFQVI